jgi:DHA2 family multidrug resistance protein
MVDQQVFTRAANDVFLASSFIFLGLMLAVWLTRRPAKAVHVIEPGGHGD